MKITRSISLPTIISALEKHTELIAPTYGPAGKKVLIATNEYSIKAADDGHEASKEFEIENEFENAVIMYMKEATEKTNSRVGDGTTTAAILTNAIVKETIGNDLENQFATQNYHGTVLEIQKATKEAVKHIKDKSKKIKTKQELYKIAYNSFNNEKIANLIADTLFKIGADGVLAIEDSQTVNTEIEIVEGLEIEKGMNSPYFINTEKEEVELLEPAVLVIKNKLDRFNEIAPLIKKLLESDIRNIVVIADGFGEDCLNNFIVHRMKGIFSPLLIEAPGFGDNKEENLKNIAAVVGTEVIDLKNTKLESLDIKSLGTAKKFVSRKDKTTIIGGSGKIDSRIANLTSKLVTQDLAAKEVIEKHIAALKGGIALIKVGANTENEQRSIKMKVEDAVNATKTAFKDGIVKGAGKTLTEIKTSSSVLNRALKAPRQQLETNGAQYLDENVYDPAGVLIAALESASSIACGLLEIGGIIVTKRKPEKDQ